MFRKLIKSIKRTANFNRKSANNGNVQRSSYTAGMVYGYIDVLRSLGHEAYGIIRGSNDYDRISYLKIDGVVLVQNGKINRDGYAELMKK